MDEEFEDELDVAPEIDDVLIAEVSDQLRDQGLDDDSVEFQIAEMRDAGMFNVPNW